MTLSKNIVVVGGSGFIGTAIATKLLSKGYSVTIIDIAPPKFFQENMVCVKANMSVEKVDVDVFKNCYGVINLAGVTTGKRWNRAYQKSIYDSRILTTRTLVQALTSLEKKPEVLISASAVGYYGNQGDKVLTEEYPPGNDFLARVCVDWENETKQVEKSGLRVVLIRTAHVLGKGGLLGTLKPLFNKGLGGYFGSGRQYMPWIHLEDVVDIYIHALEHNLNGAYNVGAGETLSQKTLFKAFANLMGVHIVWRIPYIIARLVLGNFADSLVSSQNTISEKLLKTGYIYKYVDLTSSLKNLD